MNFLKTFFFKQTDKERKRQINRRQEQTNKQKQIFKVFNVQLCIFKEKKERKL